MRGRMDGGEGCQGLGMQAMRGTREVEEELRASEYQPGPGWTVRHQEEGAGEAQVSGGDKVMDQGEWRCLEGCKGEMTRGRWNREYTGLRLRGKVRNGN